MLAFYFRSLTFQPPLKNEKRFYISLEVANDSSQTTEIFTYQPQTNRASLSETLEFLVKDPEKSSNFCLELIEFGNPSQRHLKIGKETVQINKMSPSIPMQIALPTIYGTDAIVDLTMEMSDEFREASSDDDVAEPTRQKKRHRLERLFKKDRFNFFKLKPMSHESVFGLTPVVYTIDAILNFLKWKNPHRTFAISMMLTFFILYGQTLIGLGFLIYFVFHKRVMPYFLQPSVPETYQQSKLQTYKKNFIFVRETTETVGQAYDIYRRLFLDEDRTLLIQALLLIRKFSPIMVFGLLFFNLQFLIIAGYWTLLIYNTETGREILKRAYEEGHTLMSRVEVYCAPFLKFESKTAAPEKPRRSVKAEPTINVTYPESRTSLGDITKPIANNGSRTSVNCDTRTSLSEVPQIAPRRSEKLFKEKSFITFENQRWWPGKGWRTELLPGERPSWSDDLGQVELKKEFFRIPGANWQWQNEWNIVMSSKADEEGWEYASRFKKFEDPDRKKSLIHSVRRRKWARKCVEISDE